MGFILLNPMVLNTADYRYPLRQRKRTITIPVSSRALRCAYSGVPPDQRSPRQDVALPEWVCTRDTIGDLHLLHMLELIFVMNFLPLNLHFGRNPTCFSGAI